MPVVEDVPGVAGFSKAVSHENMGLRGLGGCAPALRRGRARVVAIRADGSLPIDLSLLYRSLLH